MSYSYIKTVFPDYVSSNVYDEKMYANLNGVQPVQPVQAVQAVQAVSSPFESEFSPLKPEPFGYDVENFANQELGKDNLRYFNTPIANNNLPHYNNIDYQQDNTGNNKISGMEKFGNPIITASHEDYIKHLSSCSACKEIVLKQFNVESDRLRNEEIIELISYVMFGVFILILLDTLKK
jgi:hypothetical protein